MATITLELTDEEVKTIQEMARRGEILEHHLPGLFDRMLTEYDKPDRLQRALDTSTHANLRRASRERFEGIIDPGIGIVSSFKQIEQHGFIPALYENNAGLIVTFAMFLIARFLNKIWASEGATLIPLLIWCVGLFVYVHLWMLYLIGTFTVLIIVYPVYYIIRR